MRESDIKHETPHFFVLWNTSRKRYEVCKKTVTHSYVVGHGKDIAACIRTADKLEPYHNRV